VGNSETDLTKIGNYVVAYYGFFDDSPDGPINVVCFSGKSQKPIEFHDHFVGRYLSQTGKNGMRRSYLEIPPKVTPRNFLKSFRTLLDEELKRGVELSLSDSCRDADLLEVYFPQLDVEDPLPVIIGQMKQEGFKEIKGDFIIAEKVLDEIANETYY